MKKVISLVAVLLMSASAYAEVSQLTFSFSTPGPDAYADGRPVLTGETYLLVYVKAGAEFGGVRSDRTLVDPLNNTIVTEAKAIAGQKCEFTAIQYESTAFTDGKWVVVLLDTRDGSGKVGGLWAAQGESIKQAAGNNGTALISLTASAAGGGDSKGIKAAGNTMPVAGDIPKPEITAVEAQGETVNVHFKNFKNGQLYEVQSTSDINSWPTTRNYKNRAGDPMLSARGLERKGAVIVPSNDKVRFFRVISQ